MNAISIAKDLKNAGFPIWVDAFRYTDYSYRKAYKNGEIAALYNYGNEYDENAGKVLMDELTKNHFIGLTSNLYFIPLNKEYVKVFKFTSPTLLYFLKNFPAMIMANRNIDYYEEDILKNIKNIPTWAKIFVKAKPKEKLDHYNLLLEGISLFKRKEDSSNKAGELIYKAIISEKLIFLGFGLITTYFTVKNDDSLHYIMVHDHGGATLVYAYKEFPAYLITSPSLRFNDSHIKAIKDNNYNEDILGITD